MIRAALNDGCDAKAAFAALTTVGDFDAFGQDNIENGLTRIHDNRPARLRELDLDRQVRRLRRGAAKASLCTASGGYPRRSATQWRLQ